MSEARGLLALAVCGIWIALISLGVGLLVAVWPAAPTPTPQIILAAPARMLAPVTGLRVE